MIRKDHAQIKNIELDANSKESHPALVLSRQRRRQDAAISKITIKRASLSGAFGERHITVGPEQIKRITGEPRFFVLGSPAEYMERNAPRRAPCRQFGTGGAIDLDLPIHRRERLEIVHCIERYPWQAVAAMHLPSRAVA